MRIALTFRLAYFFYLFQPSFYYIPFPPLPEFPDLKQLKLEGHGNLTHKLVSQFLRSPYQLEHLCIEKVLEMLTVKCGTAISLKDEYRLRSELSKHPRASMNCQIHFVGTRPQERFKLFGGMTRT
ncbi:hypothetical protein Tco_0190264 [Tanacetum coccineum]